MRHIRAFVYWIGLRPRFGSIFYSPSLALTLAGKAAWKVPMKHCGRCNGWFFPLKRWWQRTPVVCEFCAKGP